MPFLMLLMWLETFFLFSLSLWAQDSWWQILPGEWDGDFKQCVALKPIGIDIKEAHARMIWKLQGGGLQGDVDLGAHGWAFSSFLEVLPDEEQTLRLTLSRDNQGKLEEYRLESKPDPMRISFHNPLTRLDKALEITLARDQGNPDLTFVLKDYISQPNKRIICAGQLIRKD